MIARTRRMLFLGAALLLGACALPQSTGRPGGNVITTEAVATTNAHTAYEVVQRLEPQWLNARGNVSLTNSAAAVPSVFVNGVETGDVEYLRNVLAEDVREIRYYAPGEAGARFGMDHPGGVIAVTLR